MIEIILQTYLTDALGIPILMEEDGEKREKYILIEKTGSGSGDEGCIETSTFAIQSYAPSLAEAAKLNKRMKEAITNMIELDEITKVELNTDYNFTDTTKKKYRYQAIYHITHY